MRHEMFHEDVKTCQHEQITELLRLEGRGCIAGSWPAWCPPAPLLWPFSAEFFYLASSLLWYMGLFLPRQRTFYFSWLNVIRFLLAHFISPLSSLWTAAETKSTGPSFPPGLWQAGPWMGQNEGQLLILILDIQSLCCMRSLDSALVRNSQTATQQLQAISITTEVSRKEFCHCCHWIIFHSPDWFVLFLFKQMPNSSMCEELLTQEVNSDFGPGEETEESLMWESVLPFLEENLGYLHCVVKVES